MKHYYGNKVRTVSVNEVQHLEVQKTKQSSMVQAGRNWGCQMQTIWLLWFALYRLWTGSPTRDPWITIKNTSETTLIQAWARLLLTSMKVRPYCHRNGKTTTTIKIRQFSVNLNDTTTYHKLKVKLKDFLRVASFPNTSWENVQKLGVCSFCREWEHYKVCIYWHNLPYMRCFNHIIRHISASTSTRSAVAGEGKQSPHSTSI